MRPTNAITLLLLAISLAHPAIAQQTPAPPLPTPDASGNYRVGNGVTAPILLFAPEPEPSKLASKYNFAGNCTVSFVVDITGHVRDARVTQSMAGEKTPAVLKAALSLDQKALEAVQKYRFQPATLQGKPVPITMQIEINFQTSEKVR